MQDVQIGMAQARTRHLDENVGRTQLRNRHVAQFDTARRGQLKCTHLITLDVSPYVSGILPGARAARRFPHAEAGHTEPARAHRIRSG
jgi:hypothetical protein